MGQAGKQNLWAYNKNLQPFANDLPKRMTKAEACLWKFVLRANKMKGYAFRRQRPIMNYIADFMCKDLMLVIEVDGFTHWNDEEKKKDEEKDKILQLAGFTILRFTDEEVLNNLSQVQEKIMKWIEEQETQKIL
jgi:very-short-patch-repair endonuclease